MKKILYNLIAIILVLAMLLPAAVFATNGDNPEGGAADPSPTTPVETPAPTEKVIKKPAVTISTSPSELVSDGSVSLSIAVYNTNAFELTNVAISVDGKTVQTLAALQGGSTYNYTGKYSVAANKLGKKIPVTVAYDGGSTSENFSISQKNAKVSVDTIVKVDKLAVEAGGQVNFSFSIENKSDVKIENASLKASTLNGGKRIGKSFSLDSGDATIISYTATITQTIDVSPVLTFIAAGKTYTKDLETVTISLNNANMEITATPSTLTPQPDEPVNFELLVSNTGNMDFTDVTLFDANDQRVTTNSNHLPAGGAISASHSMVFTESGAYDFYIVAKDADGTSYTYHSNSVNIQLAEAEAADYSEYFTLTATVADETQRLEKPGEVSIQLAIKNTYTEAFRDVTITEVNSGTVVETYSSFPVGEKVLPFTMEIQETTNFDFVMTATDPDGNPFEIAAERINIPVEGGSASGSRLSTLLIVLAIIIVLIIACGVVLIVLVVKEKKKKENMTKHRTAAVTDARRTARISRANHVPAHDAEAPEEDPAAAESMEEAPAPAVEEEEDDDVLIYTPAHRSYESLRAEPAQEPEQPEEAPEAPEDLQPLPRRRRRNFEDRNIF